MIVILYYLLYVLIINMSKNKVDQNIVEGIGWDVTIFLVPAFVIISIGAYYLYQYLKPKVSYWFRAGGDPVP